VPGRTPDQWSAARAHFDALEAAADTRAAAAAYFERWPGYAPGYFVNRSRDLTRKAFDHGEGWAARLLSCLETPAHFTLHAAHLDLPQEAAAPALFFDRANVRRWRDAIAAHFTGPHRWRLELGSAGRIHAHILADLADGPPDLPRGGELAKPCAAYFEAAVRYQLTPPLEYTAAHLALYMAAKRRGRLPNLAGSRGIPKKAIWSNPSSSGFLWRNSPETDPKEPPKIAPVATPATPQLRPATGTRPARRRPGSSYPMRRAVPTVDARARAPPRTLSS
jgi:hypothetical protein